MARGTIQANDPPSATRHHAARRSWRALPKIAALLVLVLGTSGCIRITNSRGSDGGVFRSTDAGETWVQRSTIDTGAKRPKTFSAANITGISIHPQRPDVLVVTTERYGVFRSENGGDSWQQLGLAAGSYRAHVFDPAAPARQFLGSGASVLKTSDDGATWETVYTDPRGAGVTALAMEPGNDGTVYAATSGGGLLRSTDGGTDWRLVQSFSSGVRALVANPGSPQHLLIVLGSRVMRSRDGGASIAALSGLDAYEGASSVQQIVFSPSSPNTLFAATNYGLLTSADEGDTWRPITTLVPARTLPLQSVAVDPQNPRLLFFSVGRLVHKTEDGGVTWRTIESVPTSRLIAVLAAHPAAPGTLFVGTRRIR